MSEPHSVAEESPAVEESTTVAGVLAGPGTTEFHKRVGDMESIYLSIGSVTVSVVVAAG